VVTIVFYEKPGCMTNAKQKALLTAAGHTVIAKNLLVEPWTAERLLEFFRNIPVAQWINRASPRVKTGEVNPEMLSSENALALLLNDPLLIRRPLIAIDNLRLVGFDKSCFPSWLNLQDGDSLSEGCSHKP